MADIKLRIEVNPNGSTETLSAITNKVGDISTNSNVSNTSIKANANGVFQSIPTTDFYGSNGLTWANGGELCFNSEGYLDNIENSNGYLEDEEHPQEFFWGAVPSSKEYSVKLTLSGSENLKDIVVFGDETNNQFPTRAIIDGSTIIYSDDFKWDINLGNESSSHTIEFTHWNRANYNACLTLIRVMLQYYDIDKANGLKEVESLSQSTGQPKEIYYGVVPNSGSVEVNDNNGQILELVESNVISNSNVGIEVYVNGKKVQSHISTDSEYFDNNILTANLENKLKDWTNLIYIEKKLTENQNLYNILYAVFQYFNLSDDFYEMCSNMYNQTETFRDYLMSINIGYFSIEANNSLLKIVNDACVIAQLNLIESDDGKIQFINANPIITPNKKIIKLLPKNIIKKQKSGLISKNKIENVSFDSIIYTKKDEILQPLENRTGQFEELQSFVLNGSYWNSDYYTDANSIDSDTSYTKEVYVDRYNRSWNIFYRTEKLQYYTRAIGKIYQPIISYEPANTEMRLMVYNEHSFSLRERSFMTYEDLNHFKLVLDDRYDEDIILSGFLTYAKSPYNPHINEYVNEQQVIFAYRDTITFPLQLFYISSVVDSTEGKKTIIKEQVVRTNETKSYGNGDNSINFQNNIFISNYSYINGVDARQVISNNILTNYEKGIQTANIKTICSDLYDVDGNLVKEWSKGEILQVGDIVRIDKDNQNNALWQYADKTSMLWKVTGRNFIYSGVPMIDLELQEIKQ